jgi:hypothetical protein
MYRLVVPLLLLFAANAAFGQCTDVGIVTLPQIKGQVVDGDMQPLADVKLQLFEVNPDDSLGREVQAVKTNGKGEFKFKKHKTRIYAISVTNGKKMYRPEKIRRGSVVIQRSGGLLSVLIVLDEGVDCLSMQLAP